jgi:hypothetical protein
MSLEKAQAQQSNMIKAYKVRIAALTIGSAKLKPEPMVTEQPSLS